MIYKKFTIAVSKGWALIVCSVSVAVLALMGSCRSKKVDKAPEVEAEENNPSQEYVDNKPRPEIGQGTIAVLPGDSREIREMIEESNSLRETLSNRARSVIYGPPEVMERRAAENAKIRHKIDSLDVEIRKARQK